jgi:hypothetical protein
MVEKLIAVFYPAGAFGSTVEYAIKKFSTEFNTPVRPILPDGSLHSISRDLHPTIIDEIKDYTSEGIISPRYPDIKYNSFETIEKFKNYFRGDKVIFIILENEQQIEASILFKYFKAEIRIWRDKFAENAKFWNPSYNSVNDMELWEQREMLSISMNTYLDELAKVSTSRDPNWLMISFDQILYNFPDTIKNVINYLGLTFVDDNLLEFYKDWFAHQLYILDEYNKVNQIVESIIQKKQITWEPLDNIYSEALIQTKLMRAGLIMKCYGINKFPSDTNGVLEIIDVA